ncbi:PhzF family phenazine biosynthesis protein [Halalkalibacter okhensis]|uniref:PhzF family phenazine biosynthesis protein n=1 Tax=Halalkalibacter okhensis TaxID=333138 RepID=A0A0B0ICC3_9BACI|nr:PhzF family phenazine biosynthesis protein [Halalkalibacter okhensis]KHF38920.1 PhzF family phenazine biosynthesis protein [Halalkalibacter okhensis]
MKGINIYHVDAFTDKPFGGNSAGVVPNAEFISCVHMQSIAKELNLSETAFLMPPQSTAADFRIRYFTPSSEIDFCGHATVATAWLMGTIGEWATKKNMITFETNIGHVPVKFEIKENSLRSVIMTQIEPKVKKIDTALVELANYVGLKKDDIETDYPIRLGFTGNWHLLIPVKTRKAIDEAIPQIDKLKKHNKSHNICTTHLFTFDSQEEDCLLYTRDFAPAVGIPEDPVTGAANGALAGYLILEGILSAAEAHTFNIAQGHKVGRPGKVEIIISFIDHKPIIKVGGSAVPTIAGTLLVEEEK